MEDAQNFLRPETHPATTTAVHHFSPRLKENKAREAFSGIVAHCAELGWRENTLASEEDSYHFLAAQHLSTHSIWKKSEPSTLEVFFPATAELAEMT